MDKTKALTVVLCGLAIRNGGLRQIGMISCAQGRTDWEILLTLEKKWREQLPVSDPRGE